ncbi:unnamed protein product [Dibothriocephalus latus]|uniref:Mediator of RNA polymerase II transcription subunit 11 n=1 Tax=Dibothriocephalus latus TaxID=60516 RepID=A0A3P7KX60_DIBLA|nr:unnamed protein product [Dibothriocephalus latus]
MENAQVNLEDRLRKLDDVENKVMLIMQHAGHALEELAKDKPIAKQADAHIHSFRNVVREVETELNSHLNYLSRISAGLPFEGNVYRETVELTLSAERLKIAQRILMDIL